MSPKKAKLKTTSVKKTKIPSNHISTNISSNKNYLALILLAPVVGAVSAYFIIYFISLIGFFQNLILQNQISTEVIGFQGHILGNWIYILPPLGLILVAALTKTFSNESSGVSEEQLSITSPIRLLLIKPIASAITICFGGSAGKDGVSLQLGAGIGHIFSKIIRLDEETIHNLKLSAMASCFAVSIHAPIGVAIFCMEAFSKNHKVQSQIPILLSVVIATIIARYHPGYYSGYLLPSFQIANPIELISYFGLGIVVGLYGLAFVNANKLSRKYMEIWKIHYLWKAMIGGAIISFVSIYYPQVLGLGFDSFTSALRNQGNLLLFAALMLLKPIATFITLRCGGAGGITFPIILCGAFLGGAFAMGLQPHYPDYISASGSYAIVASAAMLAATTRAYIGAMVIFFEISPDKSMLLPLMITAITASLIYRAVETKPVYEV